MADESHIRVMSQNERNDYDGVTIEEQTGEPEDRPTNQKSYNQQSGSNFSHKGFSIQHFGLKDILWNKQSWLMRLAIIAGVITVLSFMVFVALPIIITVVGVLAIIWLVMHFLFS